MFYGENPLHCDIRSSDTSFSLIFGGMAQALRRPVLTERSHEKMDNQILLVTDNGYNMDEIVSALESDGFPVESISDPEIGK